MADISEILNVIHDISDGDDEGPVVASLGEKFIPTAGINNQMPKALVLLTAKSVVQVGTYFEPNENGKYIKKRGRNWLLLDDIRGTEQTHVPVGKYVGILGWVVTLLGLAILLGGLVEGSVMGIVTALFIGAAWLMVPGALMLVHARSGGVTYLDFLTSDGKIAVQYDWYRKDDVDTFVSNLGATDT